MNTNLSDKFVGRVLQNNMKHVTPQQQTKLLEFIIKSKAHEYNYDHNDRKRVHETVRLYKAAFQVEFI